MNNYCPLCLDSHPAIWAADSRRSYYRCPNCYLIFADRNSLLSSKQEKAVYEQHENHIEDLGYRKFLSRIALPMLNKFSLAANSNIIGLDFGCGPGPALAAMFNEAGLKTVVYDPYFANDKSVLTKQYDFVTCTEAIEHFYQPHKEWQLLVNLVREGGYLGIMTKLARDLDSFKQWHYKNDPTHVSFFSQQTFLFLAKRDGLDIEFVANDAILFTKQKRIS